jgi:hypothetical protein
MQIAEGRISFNSWDGSGPRINTQDVTLSSPALQVAAVLRGFNVAYSPSEGDHHLGNLEIRLRAAFVDPTPSTDVRVRAIFGLRDWSEGEGSEEWDDKYEGTIDFAVVAE